MKFALFEFDDQSVEVGEVSWIENDHRKTDVNQLIGQRVTLSWPTTFSTRPNTRPTAKQAASEYSAVLIAISDSKLNLIGKRNKMCNGLSIETDNEKGRGKRRKIPSTRVLPSSSESSDSEEDYPVIPKAKKTKSSLQKCTDMAKDLRKQLLYSDNTVNSQKKTEAEPRSISSDDETESLDQSSVIASLRHQLKKEREEKEKLQSQLMFLEGVPQFIVTFREFMAEMKNKTVKRDCRPMTSTVIPPTSCPPTSCPPTSCPPTSCPPTPSTGSNDSDDEVYLSSNVTVKRKLLRRCNTGDASKMTCDLLVILFGREDLATHSLTGAKNTKGVGKPALDKTKVDSILDYVQRKFPEVSQEATKKVITNKLSNEAKLKKRMAFE